MDEDKILIDKFCSGDSRDSYHKESFEKLVIKYRKSAEAFAQSFLHDPYIAEDIVQESFAYIYVYRDRYNSNYSFKTYLFTIVKNKSIDYIRKNREVPSEEILYNTSINTTEQAILQKEQNYLLYNNFKKLKLDYRMAVYLIDYEEFSYKETSNIMGKSTAQIKILIFRARRKLKSLMEMEGDSGE